MSKTVITVEDISKLHITRRNVPGTKGLIQLAIGGNVVGEARATHISESVRYWNAAFSAEINGKQFDLEMKNVFSATRITKSFVEAVQFDLTGGKQGRSLEDSAKEHCGYGIPKAKPAKADSTDTPPADTPASEGEKQPETPAAEAKPARKGSGKGSSKK